MRSGALVLLALSSSCAPELPEPVQCQSTANGEAVFLEPGQSMLGPQCPDDTRTTVELLLASDEGALFLCYCRDPETLEPVW